MNYDKDIKNLNKKIKQKENKLETLKQELKERYPEDMYGVTWMSHYDKNSKKILEDIKQLKNQLSVAEQYKQHFDRGSIDDN